MTTTRGRTRRDDSGFTVVELSMVMMISAIVMAAIVGMLDTQTRAERHVHAVAGSQEQVRLALVMVQSDLRSAEPLVELDDMAKYPTQMDIMHQDFDTDAVTFFRWRLDKTKDELVRELLDDQGVATATTFRLPGVTSNTVFRYFNSRDQELVPDVTLHTRKEVANCTVKVRVLIDAAPEAGAKPIDNWSEVQLRNRLPGGVGC
jgi:prepilin-type N-terminal cleavage/methylation domain-containing protein